MQAEGISLDSFLRVKVVGGGCSGFSYDMGFDDEADKEVDFIFEEGGIMFAVDRMSAMYIFETTMDYVESLMGTGFKFDSPTATTCGCGSSFKPN